MVENGKKGVTKQNLQEQAWQVWDSLRGFLDSSETMVYQVGISTLAFMLKGVEDDETLLSSLENSFDDETTVRFLQKLLKEYAEQIKMLADKFDADTLKAAVLFAEPRLSRNEDEISTPDGVSKLALSLMNLEEDDTILDLGSGVGSFLTLAARYSGSRNLYGVELNTSAVIIANLRSFVSGVPLKVIQGNMVSQCYSHLSANKVFSNYPVGTRFPALKAYVDKNSALKKYFKDIKRTASGDWVFGLAAYLNTKQPGKTVILMTNAGTWNKPDESLRQQLVKDGIVEGVILLPENLFSYTRIPFTMLVLSQNNTKVKMVDASDIYTEERRQNFLGANDIDKIVHAYHNETEISREVEVDEIAEQEYILNPLRYITSGMEIEDGVSLGDLCISINRGAIIQSSELDELVASEETSYRYLMLQHIQDGIVDSDLPSLVGVEERYKKHCINDKNLIISKNAPFKVALAQIPEGQTVLANGNLYFLELDESRVNPLFVSVFLQSEIGMSQLNRFAKGTAVRNISIQDLKMVQIPKLPMEQQDVIAEEYENLSDELVVLQRQADLIRDKRARLLEGVAF